MEEGMTLINCCNGTGCYRCDPYFYDVDDFAYSDTYEMPAIDPTPWTVTDIDGLQRRDIWDPEDLWPRQYSNFLDNPGYWAEMEAYYEQRYAEEYVQYARERCDNDDHEWCTDGPYNGHYSESAYGNPEQVLFHVIRHRSRRPIKAVKCREDFHDRRLALSMELLPPIHAM